MSLSLTVLTIIIYGLGLLVPIFLYVFPKITLTSYFARRKIINALTYENTEFDEWLKRIHYEYERAIYYFLLYFSFIIGFPILLSGLSYYPYNAYFHIIIYGIIILALFEIIAFPVFIFAYKGFPKYHNGALSINMLAKRLRLSNFFIGITEVVTILIITYTILIPGISAFIFPPLLSAIPALEVAESLVTIGLGIVLVIHLASSIMKRELESKYFGELISGGKLSLSVKIRRKDSTESIKGNLLELGERTILIKELDNYKLGLEYSKIDSIGVKETLKEE